ncbi:unnamed protein product [Amoebophrya sp. A25]|nr:unnamed protein product [Amoebophrya sp. A25]|eukprot:GSA25T00005470001.1
MLQSRTVEKARQRARARLAANRQDGASATPGVSQQGSSNIVTRLCFRPVASCVRWFCKCLTGGSSGSNTSESIAPGEMGDPGSEQNRLKLASREEFHIENYPRIRAVLSPAVLSPDRNGPAGGSSGKVVTGTLVPKAGGSSKEIDKDPKEDPDDEASTTSRSTRAEESRQDPESSPSSSAEQVGVETSTRAPSPTPAGTFSIMKWQSTALTDSILDILGADGRSDSFGDMDITTGRFYGMNMKIRNEDFQKAAVEIFQNILGYMGDFYNQERTMRPGGFAVRIFDIILETVGAAEEISTGAKRVQELLADEIYLQIIKQLTGNKKQTSVARGWQLMCLLLSSNLKPSKKFENYMLNFLLSKKDTKGAIGTFCHFSMRCLEDMLELVDDEQREAETTSALLTAPRGVDASQRELEGPPPLQTPTLSKVKAFLDRPPIVAQITLADGEVLLHDLPISPDVNVAAVTEKIIDVLHLADHPRKTDFGLVVIDASDKTGRPLRAEDYMGDIVVSLSRKKSIGGHFVFKRKIYLKKDSSDSTSESDTTTAEQVEIAINKLMYVEAKTDIIRGHLLLSNEEEVLNFVARVTVIEKMSTIVGGTVIDIVPSPWRGKYTAGVWARKVKKSIKDATPNPRSTPSSRTTTSNSTSSPIFPSPTRSTCTDEHSTAIVELSNSKSLAGHFGVGNHFFYDLFRKDANYEQGQLAKLDRKTAEECLDLIPRKCILVVNSTGIHFLDSRVDEGNATAVSTTSASGATSSATTTSASVPAGPRTTRQVATSFDYGSVYRWGGSAKEFTLVLFDKERDAAFDLVLETTHAAGIAAMILDYIKAIMAERSKQKQNTATTS